MRTFAICMVAVLLVSTSSRAAEEPAAIIDKAIKAVGGEEKLAKTKAEQWKSKGTVELFGMKMAYTADYYFQKPDQMRFDIAMDVNGMKVKITAASDGKTPWESANDMVQDMAAKKARYFHDMIYTMNLCQILPLKDKDNTLKLVDEIKVDGKEAVGIKVSRKNERDVTLYFDKKTYHLVKSAGMIWDEFGDKDVMQENLISGWREKDGAWHFEKLIIMRDGKTFISEEFSDQKAMDKLDPKLFAKPAK